VGEGRRGLLIGARLDVEEVACGYHSAGGDRPADWRVGPRRSSSTEKKANTLYTLTRHTRVELE
jgi:hypothetical protein